MIFKAVLCLVVLARGIVVPAFAENTPIQVYHSEITQLDNRQVVSAGGYLFTKVIISKKSNGGLSVSPSSANLYGKRNFLLYSLSAVHWDTDFPESSKSLVWKAYKSVSKSEGTLTGNLSVIDRYQDKKAYYFVYAIRSSQIQHRPLGQSEILDKISQALQDKDPRLNIFACAELTLRHPGVLNLKDIAIALVSRYGQGFLWSLTGNNVSDISFLLPRLEGTQPDIAALSENTNPFNKLGKHPYNPSYSLQVVRVLIKNGYDELANRILSHSLKIYKNLHASDDLYALAKERKVSINSYFNRRLVGGALENIEIELLNSGLSLSKEAVVIVYSLGEAPVKEVKHHVYIGDLPTSQVGIDEFSKRYYQLQGKLEHSLSASVLSVIGELLVNQGYKLMGLAFIHQSLILNKSSDTRSLFDRMKVGEEVFEGSSI